MILNFSSIGIITVRLRIPFLTACHASGEGILRAALRRCRDFLHVPSVPSNAATWMLRQDAFMPGRHVGGGCVRLPLPSPEHLENPASEHPQPAKSPRRMLPRCHHHSLIIQLLIDQIHTDQRRHPFLLHRDAIEPVRLLHRSPAVGDHDKLRIFRQFM